MLRTRPFICQAITNGRTPFKLHNLGTAHFGHNSMAEYIIEWDKTTTAFDIGGQTLLSV